MAKNNSHLVPTQIVNKNGVRTTVHRKPSKDTRAGTTMPAPAAPTPSNKDRAEWINTRLTKLPNISDETMLNASKSFFDEESLAELSYRILNSGTSTGQRLAAESLSFYVGRLAEHLHKSGKTSEKTTPFSGSLIHGEITRTWNYGNILEEANLVPDTVTKTDLDDLKYAHSMVTMGDSDFFQIPEEAQYSMTQEIETHWRGVSVLSLSFDFQNESDDAGDEWDHFNSFIPWAANHSDISTVIRTVKQHQTLDPVRLEHIMEGENAGVHGSMIDGWV